MRTFIALEPPPELRSALGELSAVLQSRLTGLKWVKPNLVHLTLRFLGEIEPGRIGALSQAVADAAGEIGSFELNVTEIGHFGSVLNPRVLWLGLAASSNLSSLATGLEASLESAGFGRADKSVRLFDRCRPAASQKQEYRYGKACTYCSEFYSSVSHFAYLAPTVIYPLVISAPCGRIILRSYPL